MKPWEISAIFGQKRFEVMFEVLNALEASEHEGGNVDFEHIDFRKLKLGDKTKELFEKGEPETKKDYETFDETLRNPEMTEKREVTVIGVDGKPVKTTLFIVNRSELESLSITNIGYGRVTESDMVGKDHDPAYAIFAVYAGATDRKNPTDNPYDIAFNSASVGKFNFNLEDVKRDEQGNVVKGAGDKPVMEEGKNARLVRSINEAEQLKRAQLFPDLEKRLEKEGDLPLDQVGLTDEQKKLIETWNAKEQRFKTLRDLYTKWATPRKNFEKLVIGDPSPFVAGGSLIPASSTSVLSFEDFRQTVLKALGSE